jgi:hypothetical chaperone protein
MNDSALSIDFGTSNSLVGAIHQGKKVPALPLDPFAADPTLMRTLLYFPHQDHCYYGSEAISQYLDNELEGRLFRSFKSHLSTQSYLGTMIGNRVMPLENMVGLFLLELKKRAEKNLGTAITKAVIGKPARYSMDTVADELALHRMRKAADFAGFKDILFVPEPLAAAFDFRKSINKEKIVLIGDFGGGTSDFTITRLSPNSFSKEDVLAIDGAPLAGDALDSLFMSSRLAVYFGSKAQYRLPLSSNILSMPPGIALRLNQPAHIVHLKDRGTFEFIKEVKKCSLTLEDKKAIERLFILIEDQQIFQVFERIETTKRALSREDRHRFEFDYPGLEMNEVFFRQEFKEWAQGIHEKIFQALDRCLSQAGLRSEQIDLVCLTGGTAQVPFIRAEFERVFGRERLQTQAHFHSVLSGLVESADLWLRGVQIVS